MVSLRVIAALGAALLFNSGLAMPRTPQSPRFQQSSDNSVGEFILWSCTATAQLQRNDPKQSIIHIAPAPPVEKTQSGSDFRIPSENPLTLKAGGDRVNNIHIIKVTAIPNPHHHHRARKPEATSVRKKSNVQNGDSHVSFILDSPLKTITVKPFRKNVPLIFKAKPQLPHIEYVPVKKDENDQRSSEITVIKP